jgi:hypothetical protein
MFELITFLNPEKIKVLDSMIAQISTIFLVYLQLTQIFINLDNTF